MEKVIAIFDIGKTNKKLILFDQSYAVVYKEEIQLPQIADEDGEPCEDVNTLTNWMRDSMAEVMKQAKWAIRALNFSAYGASFVNLDSQGNIAGPLYSYQKPYPEALLKDFYDKYGPRIEISVITASPPMGMLNSGLLLYWLKRNKPDLFAEIQTSLHLPQYCNFVFSNEPKSEITSIGCHTYLWDFLQWDYHGWVYNEGIARLLPPIFEANQVQPITVEGSRLLMGIGMHDSSSALVPYLLASDAPFALISTGTWSITLNPFDPTPINPVALQKDCLNYISHAGDPIKASRLFLGNEYDHQQTRLMRHFHKTSNYHRGVRFDPALIARLLEDKPQQRKFLPLTMTGTGPFPDAFDQSADLNLFESYEEAYHQLMLDLVSLQGTSLDLAVGETDVQRVFVAGGFVRNEVFMNLLASRLKDKILISSSITGAAALGAALAIHSSWNAGKMNLDFLNHKVHRPVKDLDISDYQLLN